MDNLKVALIYDRVNKLGGAERVLLALHEIWPTAPLYTAVYNPKTAQWANGFDIRTSFLQKIPWFRTRHEFLAALTPYAFEQFDLSQYDVVISVTSAEAKAVITGTRTLHICYCLTPTRYLWSKYREYAHNGILGLGLSFLGSQLRQSDFIAAQRVDRFIAISDTVKQRIKQYYCRDSKIIYPPVEVPNAESHSKKLIVQKPYYLVVSRLVAYKKIDLAIESCNRLGRNLVIIGQGNELGNLKKIAGRTIYFAGHLTDQEVADYYTHCKAVLFPGEEDFGIVPVEAGSFGKQVIAFNQGGAAETVVHNQTGILFDKESADSLAQAIIMFESKEFSSAICRKNSRRFSKQDFQTEIMQFVDTAYREYITN